jgi:hypothetical protein
MNQRLQQSMNLTATQSQSSGSQRGFVERWLGKLSWLGLICVLGCASPGRLLGPAAIQQLHQGQSREDVVKIFGEPREVTTGVGRRTLYAYYRFDVPIGASNSDFISPFRDEAKARTLTILLNGRDEVEKFLFSESKPDLNRWSGRVGRQISSAELAKIESNQTTRQELSALLGPPYAEMLTLEGGVKLVWVYFEIMAGGAASQDLEVLVDDAGKVVTFQQSRREPRR